MNSTDIVGYTHDGCVYCPKCIPADPSEPIFADSEWDYFPSCDNCGERITDINLTYEGRRWLVLDNGTGFMRGNITDKQLWYSINDGEEIYPIDILSLKEVERYLDSNKINTVQIVRGYGARLSAPGYLDCTDWSIFDKYEDALEYLYNEIIGEYE